MCILASLKLITRNEIELNCQRIYGTLWRSSKEADSVYHDNVLDVMLSRKTHLKYTAKQKKSNKIN